MAAEHGQRILALSERMTGVEEQLRGRAADALSLSVCKKSADLAAEHGQRIASLRDRLRALEERFAREMQMEQSSRESCFSELQEQLGSEKSKRQEQASSLQDMIAKETEALTAHVRGVERHLAEEKASYDGYQGCIQQIIESMKAKLKGHDQAILQSREQCEALFKDLADAQKASQASLRQELAAAKASSEEPAAAVREGLGRLERRLEEALKAEQDARTSAVGNLESMVSGERQEREQELRQFQDACEADLARVRGLVETERRRREEDVRGLQDDGPRSPAKPSGDAPRGQEPREHELLAFGAECGSLEEGLRIFAERLQEELRTERLARETALAELRERLAGERVAREQQAGAVQGLVAKERDAREEHSRSLLEFLDGLLNTRSASSQERAPSPELLSSEGARPAAAEALDRRQLDAIRASIQAKLREQHESIEDRVAYLEKLLNESVSRCASMQATIRDLYGERGQHGSCMSSLTDHLRRLEKKLEEDVRQAHDAWEKDVYELQELVGVEILRSRSSARGSGGSPPGPS